MTELKPCPFCGEKQAYWTGRQHSEHLGYIQCPVCGARTSGDLDYEVDAAEKWNRRSSDSDTRNRVLEEAYKAGWHNRASMLDDLDTEELLNECVAEYLASLEQGDRT